MDFTYKQRNGKLSKMGLFYDFSYTFTINCATTGTRKQTIEYLIGFICSRTEQNRTDYLFDVNYTASSQSNTIIIIYISRSQILLKCLNQVVVLI